MEIEQIIQKRKEIYSSLMEYIDDTENANIEPIIKVIEKQEILKTKQEIVSTLRILSKIADNHHRTPNFLDKIGQIIQYLIQKRQTNLTDFEIYKIFKSDKRLLLLLLEQKFIQLNDQIIADIKKTKDQNKFPYIHYLYPAIKSYINETELQQLESEIKEKYGTEINIFEQKCQIGENDSYICILIRQNSVEEFASFINKNATSLSSQIQPSAFETNSFLLKNKPTLIEYASFFGSFQIILFLKYNQVQLTDSLWLYAIHSNNSDLISFLEQNVKLQKYDQHQESQAITWERVFQESIICHHDEIADHIKENLMTHHETYHYESSIINSLNYNYFPTTLSQINSKSTKSDKFFISMICSVLDKITIPTSITYISDSFFYGCSKLTEVIIPTSVVSIGNYSFGKCTSLKRITIPASIKSIESNAFDGCTSLTELSIQSLEIIGEKAFCGCSSLAQVSIISVTEIKPSAFRNCKSLEKLSIQNVDYIRSSAFRDCSSLKEISILNAIIIEDYAFCECIALTKISIPSSLTSIGEYAFYKCSRLITFSNSIPSSLTSIGCNIFNNCKSLSQITIPSSVTIISVNAFGNCTSLSQISIPSSVTKIDHHAFYNCKSLAQISFESPSSLTSIGHEAFRSCSSLLHISLPPTVTSIGYGAFYYCSLIEEITIPSVSVIEQSVFFMCRSLKYITFQSNIPSIDGNTFCGIPNHVQITIPRSVNLAGCYFHSNVNIIRT